MQDSEDKRYDEEAKLESFKEFIKKIYPNSVNSKPVFKGDCEIDYWELL